MKPFLQIYILDSLVRNGSAYVGFKVCDWTLLRLSWSNSIKACGIA